jgi:hypothetical protein
MRIRKPAQVAVKSFVFRPRGTVEGKYSIGFGIESSGPGAAVNFSWCGSRRQIHLMPHLSSYVTNLRLARKLSADDVFVLTISAPLTLILSIDIWKAGEPTEDIIMEEVDGEAPVQTVCANPETDRDRKFDEQLVLGEAKVAAHRQTPVGSINSLRELPEGAMLYVSFQRLPDDAKNEDLLVKVAIGEMRRLCIIAAGRNTNGATFWLQPETAGKSWPLTFWANRPFSWTGMAQRGFDSVFLPAFTFIE